MKILAFSDLHADFKALSKLKKKVLAGKVDLVIAAGDLSIFGHGYEKVIKELDGWGIQVLLIHGNHETAHMSDVLCDKCKNVEFIHKKRFEKDNVVVIGYGGGGFAGRDIELEKCAKQLKSLTKSGKKLIFVIHGPAYKMLDDIRKSHVGCKSRAKIINELKPDLVVCGHLHEDAGKKMKVGNILVVNGGWDG